jgi:hypothetical protein
MSTTQTAQTLISDFTSLTNTVSNVAFLNVNGGRFAEISYGITGEMSVLLEQPDAVASLFASADAELEKSRQAMKRATVMRNAAWKLSMERTNKKALSL